MTHRSVGLVLALGSVLPSLAARAQAPARVDVGVDATGAGTALERVWPNYGYDEVNYTTTQVGRDLLGTVASINTAPVHIRTHFLLNTGDGTGALKWGSTNVYTEDAAGNPVYDYRLLDGIMDTITGAGALPLVEIAFMPQALSTQPTPYRNSTTTALDGGCFYPPRDYTKWRALINAWALHTQARYPGAETSWLWELWNEPNIGYWHGTAADYAKLYDYTEAALHGVFPKAILGGPEMAGVGSFLTQFLQHCVNGTNAVTGQAGARLDMVTFHAKGGTSIVNGNVRMDMGNQLRQHRDGFTIIAGFPQFKQTPITIGEADPDGCAACPVSTTPANAYRNSPAYGAYEVAMMKRTLELEARLGVNVRGLVTWAFTYDGAPYFPGYRALANNGIHMPVLSAFQLLGSLTGNRVPVTSSGARTLDDILANGVRAQADVDALAARDGTRVQVLVWNYHDDLVAAAATPVRVTVQLPAGFGARAAITHLRMDESHGDAYTIWTSQGSPAAPSAAQRAALIAGMDPSALEPARTADVTAGALTLDFDLPRFGVSLVTIAPAGAAGADAGAADARGSDGGAAGSGGAAGGGGAGGASAAGGAGGGAGSGAGGGAGVSGAGGAGAGTGGGTAGAGGGAGSPPNATKAGCGCVVAGGRGSGGVPVPPVAAGVALLLLLRRSRARR